MAQPTLIPYAPLVRMAQDERISLLPLLAKVLDSGVYIRGTELEEFELEFASYIGVEHCVGVGNGLDALRLALLACGIGQGDEVIVPAHTFAATILAVLQTGAMPIIADVSLATGSLDLQDVSSKLTSRTRAVIPVHLHGLPCDVRTLRSLIDGRDVLILEDAAQAHGAAVEDKMVGGLGDIGAFSFYPTKNLGALGDGGAVTTNDANVASRVRQIANYGSRESKYSHEIVGLNSRLDEIQAVILNQRLTQLDKENECRREIASLFFATMAFSDFLRPLIGSARLYESVWHHFVLLADERNEFRKFLSHAGICSEMHYPTPAYTLPAFAGVPGLGPRARGRFPNAERICARAISIPLHPWLRLDEVERICRAVNDYCSMPSSRKN